MDKKRCTSCGETPKCACKNKDFTKAVIEIDNPEQITLMRKVIIPASMGDDTTVPPVVGKYHNVLLYYEANSKSYLYSSDGIPTQLNNGITDYEDAINLPQINGVTLRGNKTSEELGLQGEIANIEQYARFFDTVADMKASEDLAAGDYARTGGFYALNDGGGALYKITDTGTANEMDVIAVGDLYAQLIYTTIINPEKFGAVGDGVTDDYEAIKRTHEYANENNIPVFASPNKTYYIHNIPERILVTTDVDWNGCKFIIDDRGNIENNPLFEIKGNDIIDVTNSITSEILPSTNKINLNSYGKAIVKIVDSNKRDWIRKGDNADNGVARTEYFTIDNNGEILNAINFPFNTITEAKLKPIEESNISIKNGNFETISSDTNGSTYLMRNIYITRSNVTIENIVHTVNEENIAETSPYAGFIYTDFCSNVLIKNCKLTAHKNFNNYGTYEIGSNGTINITYDNIVQINSVTDTQLWGINGSNYCKEVKWVNSYINRIDGHKGTTNLTIDKCVIGQRIVIVGFGELKITNTKGLNYVFIELRPDYGSFWNGKVTIKNCELKSEINAAKAIFTFNNNHDHNFGYKTYLPDIDIDNFYFNNGTIPYICRLMLNQANASDILTPDFSKTWEENAENNVYPLIYPKNIKLKNINTSNSYFIPTDDKTDFQNCYFENLGSAEVVGVKSRGFDKNYNYYLEIDSCQISTAEQVNTYANNINSVFRTGSIQGIDGSPSHHGVGKVTLNNCEYLQLGTTGRMITYYINNSSVYSTASGWTYNYACFVMDKCHLHMHYNGDSTNARFTFGTYSTKITNSEYIIDDETFSNVANKEYIFLVRSVAGGHSSVRYISINNDFNLSESDYNSITVFNSNKANYLWDIEKFITTPVFETENIKVSTSAKRPDYNLMAGVSYYDTNTSAIVSYNGNSWS